MQEMALQNDSLRAHVRKLMLEVQEFEVLQAKHAALTEELEEERELTEELRGMVKTQAWKLGIAKVFLQGVSADDGSVEMTVETEAKAEAEAEALVRQVTPPAGASRRAVHSTATGYASPFASAQSVSTSAAAAAEASQPPVSSGAGPSSYSNDPPEMDKLGLAGPTSPEQALSIRLPQRESPPGSPSGRSPSKRSIGRVPSMLSLSGGPCSPTTAGPASGGKPATGSPRQMTAASAVRSAMQSERSRSSSVKQKFLGTGGKASVRAADILQDVDNYANASVHNVWARAKVRMPTYPTSAWRSFGQLLRRKGRLSKLYPCKAYACPALLMLLPACCCALFHRWLS